MDNHHIDDLLPGFALGSLDEEEHREVLHHLTGCPRCRARIARVPRSRRAPSLRG